LLSVPRLAQRAADVDADVELRRTALAERDEKIENLEEQLLLKDDEIESLNDQLYPERSAMRSEQLFRIEQQRRSDMETGSEVTNVVVVGRKLQSREDSSNFNVHTTRYHQTHGPSRGNGIC
jgi:hypothetical protein